MKSGMTSALSFIAAAMVLMSVHATRAYAQDLDFNNYRRFLMSGESTNKKLAIQTTCTTAEDEVFRIGEAGYDECLNTLRRARRQKPSAEKSESLGNASTETTIHIGD